MIHLPTLHQLCAPLRRLCHALPRQCARGPAPASSTGPWGEVLPAAVQAPEDRPKGCGWFDSSYELGQGLEVCEHGADSAAQALAAAPLADWLEFQLGTWRLPAAALGPQA